MNARLPVLAPSLHRRAAARALAVLLAAVVLALSGCGGGTSSRRQLTERQRDSTLGRSVIPGAGTVTRALQVSDRAAAAAAARNAEVEATTP